MASFTTCVVTVTYGERTHLLAQVLAAARECGATGAIVVDNGTPLSAQKKLALLREEMGEDFLQIVRLPENTGSAGGFHAGLKEAVSRQDVDFLWVLDDDTVPQKGALAALEMAWQRLGATVDNALMSFRVDKRAYQKVVARKFLHWIEPDAFFDFNIGHLWNGGKRRARLEGGCIELGVAAYGGIWFAHSWLERITLPPTEFYLYFDDYAFSQQIPQSGCSIWLCPESRLHDIDQSWQANTAQSDRKKMPHPWLAKSSEDRRVFYTVRNRIWLERPSVVRPWLYRLNIIGYCTVKVAGLTVLRSPRTFLSGRFLRQRIGLIARAIREGLG